MNSEILIVGAGPTGLMLAILLAEEKINFRIIDENPGRVRESRALAIQPRSMELFQKIGLVEKFLERGVQGKGLNIVVRGKRAATLNFKDIGRKDTPFPYIFFLSQSVTEEILEDNLVTKFGIHVERESRLLNLRQTHDGVEATIRDKNSAESSIHCKFLVGCDGARSAVRQSLNLNFSGGTYGAEFMLADAKVDGDIPTDHISIVLGDKFSAILMPLRGSSLSRVITIGEKEVSPADSSNLITKTDVTFDEIKESFQEAFSRPVTLSDPQWISKYRVHHRSVERMKVGRIFLAGDAAHIHSPAGGQGMNTGLQDAANLAWKLACVLRKDCSEMLLETYHSERMPIAQKLLRFTDKIFNMASSQRTTVKHIRNLLIPFLGKFLFSTSKFRKYMFGFVSQLNIHYHESIGVAGIFKTIQKDKKLCPGDRFPDFKLRDGSTIFEWIRGYEFHVIVLTKKMPGAEMREDFERHWHQHNLMGSHNARIHWIDLQMASEIFIELSIEDTLVCLVRPDGYIGFQADHLEIFEEISKFDHPVREELHSSYE